MKKSILVVVAIVVLAVGGFCLYKFTNVFPKAAETVQTELVETEIEVVETVENN